MFFIRDDNTFSHSIFSHTTSRTDFYYRFVPIEEGCKFYIIDNKSEGHYLGKVNWRYGSDIIEVLYDTKEMLMLDWERTEKVEVLNANQEKINLPYQISTGKGDIQIKLFNYSDKTLTSPETYGNRVS